jgi:hypothetical protein
MSRPDTTDPLDLMRRLDPVDAEALRAGLGEEAIERAMARAIELGEGPSANGAPAAGAAPPPMPRPVAPRRARSRRALALGAALVVAIAAVLVATGALLGGGSHPSYAAAAIEVAEANPRLLVTAPGWKVTGAGEFRPDEGTMEFADGSRSLELDWYPARLYRGLLRDRSEVSAPRHSRLLGRPATTVEYRRGEYATILAPMGRVFVEVRGDLGDRAAYDALLRSLRPVDVDAWLGAMPPDVVKPAERAPVVDRMLRGIPRPPGFDPSGLEAGTAVLGHYELGVRVADAISCGWVESWIAARRAGDADAARRAVEAMSGSHRWPLLRRMRREEPGGWTRNIETVTKELQAGRLNRDFGEAVVNPDGTGYKLGPAWATGLECHDAIRRKPFVEPGSPGA